jgi:NAD(P)-dependent dehydrogenase (short-subunit alcohol dehydrogenase family)
MQAVSGEASAMGRFDGKVALITGGAYGIGRVYGRALAAEGAAIVIADLDDARTAQTVGEFEAEGWRALGVTCDVADEGQVEAAVAAAVDRFGGVDILVNNAGVHLMGSQPLLELPRDEWRRTVEVNVTGAINCAAAVRSSMRSRGGGVIVNQLSTAAFGPGGGAYTVTKLAAGALVATFAKELAADGIRVYGIAPGLVDSEAAMAAKSEQEVAALVDRQLIQRLGRMEDLAKTLVFFCSDDASFITGETLIVGGGYPLRI